MKRLSVDQIKMTRELEKSEGTFEHKNIWGRAWQMMRENHYAVYSNGSVL